MLCEADACGDLERAYVELVPLFLFPTPLLYITTWRDMLQRLHS